jgi:hypothetical protein
MFYFVKCRENLHLKNYVFMYLTFFFNETIEASVLKIVFHCFKSMFHAFLIIWALCSKIRYAISVPSILEIGSTLRETEFKIFQKSKNFNKE